MKIEDEIHQKQFRNEWQKAGINLLFTTNWFLNRQREFFTPFDITAQQFNVLRILRGQHPGSISTSVIKERMLDRNSDVSRIVDRLLQRGLVHKKTSTSDKRLVDVRINQSGLDLLEALDQHNDTLDHMVGNLNEEEARQLSALLDKMRN